MPNCSYNYVIILENEPVAVNSIAKKIPNRTVYDNITIELL
jgi:hypothetical protein